MSLTNQAISGSKWNFTMLFFFPIHAQLFLLSEFLLRFKSWKKWIEAIYPLQILSAVYFFRCLISPIGSLVVVTGKASLSFYFNVLQLLTIPVFIVVYKSYGISGFLYTQLLVIIVSFFLHYFMMVKKMLPDLKLTKFLSSFSQNILLNFSIIVPSYFFINFFGAGFISSSFVFVFYAVCVFVYNYKFNPLFTELLIQLKLKK
jgi:O-antigen/teichoic acid export membrane protein